MITTVLSDTTNRNVMLSTYTKQEPGETAVTVFRSEGFLCFGVEQADFVERDVHALHQINYALDIRKSRGRFRCVRLGTDGGKRCAGGFREVGIMHLRVGPRQGLHVLHERNAIRVC